MEMDLEKRKLCGKEHAFNKRKELAELKTFEEILEEMKIYKDTLYGYQNRYEVKFTFDELIEFMKDSKIAKQKIWNCDDNKIYYLADCYDIFGNYYVIEKTMFIYQKSYDLLERQRKIKALEFINQENE